MKIFLTSSMLVFCASSFAQESQSLDSLVSINKNNFCYQTSDQQKGFKKFYQLNDEGGKYYFLSIPVLSLGYAKPVLEVTQTQQDMEKTLNKTIKPSDVKLMNIYTLTHEVNFQLAAPPLEVLNTIYKKVPGLNFNTEQYGGSYVFTKNETLNLSKVKTAKDAQAQIDAQQAYAFSFKMTPSNGGTLINYKCEMKINTTKKPVEVAIDLVD